MIYSNLFKVYCDTSSNKVLFISLNTLLLTESITINLSFSFFLFMRENSVLPFNSKQEAREQLVLFLQYDKLGHWRLNPGSPPLKADALPTVISRLLIVHSTQDKKFLTNLKLILRNTSDISRNFNFAKETKKPMQWCCLCRWTDI